MSDDFGLLNLVETPFLERISREERMSEDLPKKPRNPKTDQAKKKAANNEPDESPDGGDSSTFRLIDLRI
ncbi:MAG: hypothetical protein JW793_15215 [Acidobacteria bacterium]|nr:hypothetical protein [Acidobacteriota bacterium]